MPDEKKKKKLTLFQRLMRTIGGMRGKGRSKPADPSKMPTGVRGKPNIGRGKGNVGGGGKSPPVPGAPPRLGGRPKRKPKPKEGDSGSY